MSSDVAIAVESVSKCYLVFERPQDRLWQMLWRGRRQFYREYWALQEISVEVRRGETLGILGRNGAGKSTLLQILTGTLQPSGGRITTHGRVAALLELGAGFNPEFTGHENVFLAASILGLSNDQITERYNDIVTFAGIGDFIEQPVKVYSSGMYARLAFAVAAHVDADILIIDEILSVGDAAFTQKCMRFINRFKEHGTILFVTHDTAAAVKLCDRVLWMENGRIRELGVAKEVCEHYIAGVSEGDDPDSSFRIGRGKRGEARGERPRLVVDPRHGLLKGSDRANHIEVFDFDPEADWFGHRGATIRNVTMVDAEGCRLTAIMGGELVILRVLVEAHQEVVNPIIGFYIRDRLGQNLFGDNTYLTTLERNLRLGAGQTVTTDFRFQMPYLHAGDFVVTVAVAEGVEADHIHHHWIDDALFFKVVASHFAHGLIGIPMLGIDIDVGR